mgnify:CR=1 FL=1
MCNLTQNMSENIICALAPFGGARTMDAVKRRRKRAIRHLWSRRREGETVIVPFGSRERFLIPPDPAIERLIRASPAAARLLPPRPPVDYLASHGVLLAGISHLKRGYRVERDHAGFHLVLFAQAGSARCRIANTEMPFVPGDVLVAPADGSYAYWPRADWHIQWFHLKPGERWNRLVGTAVVKHHALWAAPLRAAMESYLDELGRLRPDSALVLQPCAEIAMRTLERELLVGEDPIGRALRLRMENLWHAVRAGIGQNWDIPRLAAQARISPPHLHRVCRRLYGRAPMQVVTLFRMQRAAELLRHTDFTLAHIADEVGYDGPFAFSKAFKRTTGFSPAAMRRAGATSRIAEREDRT